MLTVCNLITAVTPPTTAQHSNSRLLHIHLYNCYISTIFLTQQTDISHVGRESSDNKKWPDVKQMQTVLNIWPLYWYEQCSAIKQSHKY